MKDLLREACSSSGDDNSSSPRTEMHSVGDVLSPNTLVLKDSRTIRLLGIRPMAAKPDEAIEFLRRMTDGQHVFMKQDKAKSDETGMPLVYLYREDGAFLNALMVKYDLVDVDESIPFRYLPRFLKKQRDNREKL